MPRRGAGLGWARRPWVAADTGTKCVGSNRAPGSSTSTRGTGPAPSASPSPWAELRRIDRRFRAVAEQLLVQGRDQRCVPARGTLAEALWHGPVDLIVSHEGGRELQAKGVCAPVRPVDVLPRPLAAEVVVIADIHEVALRVALAAAAPERAEAGRQAEVLLRLRWFRRRQIEARRAALFRRRVVAGSRVLPSAVVSRDEPVADAAAARTGGEVVLEVVPSVHDPEHARRVRIGVIRHAVRAVRERRREDARHLRGFGSPGRTDPFSAGGPWTAARAKMPIFE